MGNDKNFWDFEEPKLKPEEVKQDLIKDYVPSSVKPDMGNHATNVPKFDFEIERKKLVTSLDKLKGMSVQEFTFYKKWEELQSLSREISSNADLVHKPKIWNFDDINDETRTIQQIDELDPEVIFVEEDDDHYEAWNILRLFGHTMEFSQNPGRFLRFFVIDKASGKYLGVLSVASDVIIITDRDKYIGWTMDHRLKDKKLAHSAIGSCIMPTQPFGYNFLGGKLAACMITSKVVRDTWERLYGQKLVGITTTSLYGSYSMYNNIPWWHKCGTSAGKILIKPDQGCYDVWHKWLKENRKEKYEKAMTQKEGVSGPVTAAKLRILSMIMDACEIKQKNYTHGYERGCFSSLFYINSKEFLCKKIQEKDLVLNPRMVGDVKSIMEWWKPKAINRYRKLFAEKNLKPEILFYSDVPGMPYEDAKTKYFADVGR